MITPFVVYFLPSAEDTQARSSLRKVREMSTSSREMECGGQLLFMPDFDALTDRGANQPDEWLAWTQGPDE